MRLFFIPGFGEDPSIFDKIHPHIPGDKVLIKNWELIGDQPRPALTALQYARELVEEFGITQDDVVIGHSMGGWIAFHIKHLVHCPIVQIASWTNDRKVARFTANLPLVYWMVKKGLYFNRLVKYLLVHRKYRNRPSEGILGQVFDRLRKGNKDNVVNQLRIVFTPTDKNITEQPDLRIHARADRIIYFPDDPCLEVEGDHFTLYTHPEQVYRPILAFMEQRETKSAV